MKFSLSDNTSIRCHPTACEQHLKLRRLHSNHRVILIRSPHRCSLRPQGPASVLPGPSRTSETSGLLLVCLEQQSYLQQTQLQPHILAWDGDGRRRYPVTIHLGPWRRVARGLNATEPAAD